MMAGILWAGMRLMVFSSLFENSLIEFGINTILISVIIMFGFFKKSIIPKLDRLDLSYGIYVYAWPVSQASSMIDTNIYVKLLAATVGLISLSYVSFVFIEKPHLQKKNLFSNFRIRKV